MCDNRYIIIAKIDKDRMISCHLESNEIEKT